MEPSSDGTRHASFGGFGAFKRALSLLYKPSTEPAEHLSPVALNEALGLPVAEDEHKSFPIEEVEILAELIYEASNVPRGLPDASGHTYASFLAGSYGDAEFGVSDNSVEMARKPNVENALRQMTEGDGEMQEDDLARVFEAFAMVLQLNRKQVLTAYAFAAACSARIYFASRFDLLPEDEKSPVSTGELVKALASVHAAFYADHMDVRSDAWTQSGPCRYVLSEVVENVVASGIEAKNYVPTAEDDWELSEEARLASRVLMEYGGGAFEKALVPGVTEESAAAWREKQREQKAKEAQEEAAAAADEEYVAPMPRKSAPVAPEPMKVDEEEEEEEEEEAVLEEEARMDEEEEEDEEEALTRELKLVEAEIEREDEEKRAADVQGMGEEESKGEELDSGLEEDEFVQNAFFVFTGQRFPVEALGGEGWSYENKKWQKEGWPAGLEIDAAFGCVIGLIVDEKFEEAWNVFLGACQTAYTAQGDSTARPPVRGVSLTGANTSTVVMCGLMARALAWKGATETASITHPYLVNLFSHYAEYFHGGTIPIAADWIVIRHAFMCAASILSDEAKDALDAQPMVSERRAVAVQEVEKAVRAKKFAEWTERVLPVFTPSIGEKKAPVGRTAKPTPEPVDSEADAYLMPPKKVKMMIKLAGFPEARARSVLTFAKSAVKAGDASNAVIAGTYRMRAAALLFPCLHQEKTLRNVDDGVFAQLVRTTFATRLVDLSAKKSVTQSTAFNETPLSSALGLRAMTAEETRSRDAGSGEAEVAMAVDAALKRVAAGGYTRAVIAETDRAPDEHVIFAEQLAREESTKATSTGGDAVAMMREACRTASDIASGGPKAGFRSSAAAARAFINAVPHSSFITGSFPTSEAGTERVEVPIVKVFTYVTTQGDFCAGFIPMHVQQDETDGSYYSDVDNRTTGGLDPAKVSCSVHVLPFTFPMPFVGVPTLLPPDRNEIEIDDDVKASVEQIGVATRAFMDGVEGSEYATMADAIEIAPESVRALIMQCEPDGEDALETIRASYSEAYRTIVGQDAISMDVTQKLVAFSAAAGFPVKRIEHGPSAFAPLAYALRVFLERRFHGFMSTPDEKLTCNLSWYRSVGAGSTQYDVAVVPEDAEADLRRASRLYPVVQTFRFAQFYPLDKKKNKKKGADEHTGPTAYFFGRGKNDSVAMTTKVYMPSNDSVSVDRERRFRHLYDCMLGIGRHAKRAWASSLSAATFVAFSSRTKEETEGAGRNVNGTFAARARATSVASALPPQQTPSEILLLLCACLGTEGTAFTFSRACRRVAQELERAAREGEHEVAFLGLERNFVCMFLNAVSAHLVLDAVKGHSTPKTLKLKGPKIEGIQNCKYVWKARGISSSAVFKSLSILLYRLAHSVGYALYSNGATLRPIVDVNQATSIRALRALCQGAGASASEARALSFEDAARSSGLRRTQTHILRWAVAALGGTDKGEETGIRTETTSHGGIVASPPGQGKTAALLAACLALDHSVTVAVVPYASVWIDETKRLQARMGAERLFTVVDLSGVKATTTAKLFYGIPAGAANHVIYVYDFASVSRRYADGKDTSAPTQTTTFLFIDEIHELTRQEESDKAKAVSVMNLFWPQVTFAISGTPLYKGVGDMAKVSAIVGVDPYATESYFTSASDELALKYGAANNSMTSPLHSTWLPVNIMPDIVLESSKDYPDFRIHKAIEVVDRVQTEWKSLQKASREITDLKLRDTLSEALLLVTNSSYKSEPEPVRDDELCAVVSGMVLMDRAAEESVDNRKREMSADALSSTEMAARALLVRLGVEQTAEAVAAARDHVVRVANGIKAAWRIGPNMFKILRRPLPPIMPLGNFGALFFLDKKLNEREVTRTVKEIERQLKKWAEEGERLPKVVPILGPEDIYDFQNKYPTRVLIGVTTREVAESSLTITRANLVVFVTPPDTPGAHEQCTARITRIGQKFETYAVSIVSEGREAEAMRVVREKIGRIRNVKNGAAVNIRDLETTKLVARRDRANMAVMMANARRGADARELETEEELASLIRAARAFAAHLPPSTRRDLLAQADAMAANEDAELAYTRASAIAHTVDAIAGSYRDIVQVEHSARMVATVRHQLKSEERAAEYDSLAKAMETAFAISGPPLTSADKRLADDVEDAYIRLKREARDFDGFQAIATFVQHDRRMWVRFSQRVPRTIDSLLLLWRSQWDDIPAVRRSNAYFQIFRVAAFEDERSLIGKWLARDVLMDLAHTEVSQGTLRLPVGAETELADVHPSWNVAFVAMALDEALSSEVGWASRKVERMTLRTDAMRLQGEEEEEEEADDDAEHAVFAADEGDVASEDEDDASFDDEGRSLQDEVHMLYAILAVQYGVGGGVDAQISRFTGVAGALRRLRKSIKTVKRSRRRRGTLSRVFNAIKGTIARRSWAEASAHLEGPISDEDMASIRRKAVEVALRKTRAALDHQLRVLNEEMGVDTDQATELAERELEVDVGLHMRRDKVVHTSPTAAEDAEPDAGVAPVDHAEDALLDAFLGSHPETGVEDFTEDLAHARDGETVEEEEEEPMDLDGHEDGGAGEETEKKKKKKKSRLDIDLATSRKDEATDATKRAEMQALRAKDRKREATRVKNKLRRRVRSVRKIREAVESAFSANEANEARSDRSDLFFIGLCAAARGIARMPIASTVNRDSNPMLTEPYSPWSLMTLAAQGNHRFAVESARNRSMAHRVLDDDCLPLVRRVLFKREADGAPSGARPTMRGMLDATKRAFNGARLRVSKKKKRVGPMVVHVGATTGLTELESTPESRRTLASPLPRVYARQPREEVSEPEDAYMGDKLASHTIISASSSPLLKRERRKSRRRSGLFGMRSDVHPAVRVTSVAMSDARGSTADATELYHVMSKESSVEYAYSVVERAIKDFKTDYLNACKFMAQMYLATRKGDLSLFRQSDTQLSHIYVSEPERRSTLGAIACATAERVHASTSIPESSRLEAMRTIVSTVKGLCGSYAPGEPRPFLCDELLPERARWNRCQTPHEVERHAPEARATTIGLDSVFECVVRAEHGEEVEAWVIPKRGGGKKMPHAFVTFSSTPARFRVDHRDTIVMRGPITRAGRVTSATFTAPMSSATIYFIKREASEAGSGLTSITEASTSIEDDAREGEDSPGSEASQIERRTRFVRHG